MRWLTVPLAVAAPGFALQIAAMPVVLPTPDSSPLDLFQAWFSAAVEVGSPMPDAMTLATATPDSRPSARMVLLKGVGEEGLTFFTNYESRKADELTRNPRAALLFWWPALNVQVRVEGWVNRIDPAASDAYFATRPRLSQLGAHASPQSRPIPHHSVLLERVDEFARRFEGMPVPRPPHWGGFRVAPELWEFWVGHEGRLHERFLYTRRPDGGWDFAILAP